MSGEFLKGFRALDLTDLSGQLCGRLLADLGMEVIKIEPPGGDPVRNLAPFVKSADGKLLSTTFAHLNAGKASKVLDLETDAGRAALRQLVETADVVIESFQPGELDTKGLGYKDLAAINPGIVMASISAFRSDRTEEKSTRATISSRWRKADFYIFREIRHWRHAGRRKPRPTISRACLPRPGCSPRFTGASARAKAITSTRRCRRRWRRRSTSSDCGPMKNRFSSAPAASMARWRRRKFSSAATASFIFT